MNMQDMFVLGSKRFVLREKVALSSVHRLIKRQLFAFAGAEMMSVFLCY